MSTETVEINTEAAETEFSLQIEELENRTAPGFIVLNPFDDC